MKKEKFDKLMFTIVAVSAIIEVVCGKKALKRVLRRLSVLDKVAVVEVLVGVHNRIRPDNCISTGNNHFAQSPIVKYESKRILDILLSSKRDLSQLDDRLKEIIDRRMQQIKSKKA